MINQLLLICSIVIIYEFLRFLKLKEIIILNLKIYKKILKLFYFEKVSFFRKSKLILSYSKSLLLLSIKLFFILICVLIVLLAINLINNSFLNLFLSTIGIIESSLLFIIYHKIKKKNYAKL